MKGNISANMKSLDRQSKINIYMNQNGQQRNKKVISHKIAAYFSESLNNLLYGVATNIAKIKYFDNVFHYVCVH